MATGVPLLMKVVATSVSVANRAGLIIRDTMRSGNLNIVDKGINDLQTEADRSAQRCIVSSLSKQFPNIKVIGEETLDDSTPVKNEWIIMDMDPEVLTQHCPQQFANVKDDEIIVWVDPLDGTSEYTQGFLDNVTVLIGIAVNGKAIAGVIHQPYHKHKKGEPVDETATGRTIWGIVGLGAFGLDMQPDYSLEKRVITTTRSHMSPSLEVALVALRPTEVIRCGGAGYKSLLVAEGFAQAYLHPSAGCKKWDTCAPEAILRSIGGALTDILGNEYRYDENVQHMNAGGVLACKDMETHEFFVEKMPNEVKAVIRNKL